MLMPSWGYTASLSVSDLTTLSQFYAPKIEKSKTKQKIQHELHLTTMVNMKDLLVAFLFCT